MGGKGGCPEPRWGQEGRGGHSPWMGEGEGVDEGGRGNEDGLHATGIKSSYGTGSPATTECPFRRAHNCTVARTML